MSQMGWVAGGGERMEGSDARKGSAVQFRRSRIYCQSWRRASFPEPGEEVSGIGSTRITGQAPAPKVPPLPFWPWNPQGRREGEFWTFAGEEADDFNSSPGSRTREVSGVEEKCVLLVEN